MVYSIIEGIRILLLYLLLTQFAYGFLIFLLESTMISFYALAIYEKPSNLYQKSVNFFMTIVNGSGYHIYLKLRKHNWFVRKFFFLIALIIQGVASVIIYYTIYGTLKAIFL